MNQSKSTIGFTIVELLIVIVVIGILAAITVVAYSGVQDRARMAVALTFEKQLRSKYHTDATGNWNFDECSGGVVGSGTLNRVDSNPIIGTPRWITDTPSGTGCALRFDGSNRIETQATLGSSAYVKAAWVRISTPTCGSNNIISQSATGGVAAAFYMPSCRPAAGHNGAWSTSQSPLAINDGKWHYVAAIWEDASLSIWIDGKNTITTTGIAPAGGSDAGTVAIGSHSGGNTMIGDIDNPFVAGR